jgi:hypothetical protein
VLDRNPLVDLSATTSLRYVMKNGRLYDAGTLDEVWPRDRRTLDEPWRHTAPIITSAGSRGGAQ